MMLIIVIFSSVLGLNSGPYIHWQRQCLWVRAQVLSTSFFEGYKLLCSPVWISLTFPWDWVHSLEPWTVWGLHSNGSSIWTWTSPLPCILFWNLASGASVPQWLLICPCDTNLVTDWGLSDTSSSHLFASFRRRCGTVQIYSAWCIF